MVTVRFWLKRVGAILTDDLAPARVDTFKLTATGGFSQGRSGLIHLYADYVPNLKAFLIAT
jgi:hypothetical protein